MTFARFNWSRFLIPESWRIQNVDWRSVVKVRRVVVHSTCLQLLASSNSISWLYIWVCSQWWECSRVANSKFCLPILQTINFMMSSSLISLASPSRLILVSNWLWLREQVLFLAKEITLSQSLRVLKLKVTPRPMHLLKSWYRWVQSLVENFIFSLHKGWCL